MQRQIGLCSLQPSDSFHVSQAARRKSALLWLHMHDTFWQKFSLDLICSHTTIMHLCVLLNHSLIKWVCKQFAKLTHTASFRYVNAAVFIVDQDYCKTADVPMQAPSDRYTNRSKTLHDCWVMSITQPWSEPKIKAFLQIRLGKPPSTVPCS